jgi:hypothetical protein
MSRLKPPPFVGGPLRPGILKRAEFEIAVLQTGPVLVSNSAMLVDRFVEQLPAPALSSNSAIPVDKSVEQLPAPARPNLRLQRFKREAPLVLSSNSAMPVEQSVEQLPAPSDSSFSSLVKPVRESNGENGESTDCSDSDTNAESAQQGGYNTDKPKRAWNGRADYRLVKTWDIRENRTQDIEESRHELYLMSRNFFEDSKTLKLPTHKSLPTDIYMWKKYYSYKSAKSDALIRIFRCPMKNRTTLLYQNDRVNQVVGAVLSWKT